MRKSIAILALWTTAISPCFGIAERLPDERASGSLAYAPGASGNPLMRLPGMSDRSGFSGRMPLAQPQPVISDVINIPNPFDSRKAGPEGQTQIAYTLASDAAVQVTLYDLLGIQVKKWQFSSGQNGGKSGPNSFFWDGTNESGQKVSKGGYLAQIEVSRPDGVATVIRKIGLLH